MNHFQKELFFVVDLQKSQLLGYFVDQPQVLGHRLKQVHDHILLGHVHVDRVVNILNNQVFPILVKNIQNIFILLVEHFSQIVLPVLIQHLVNFLFDLPITPFARRP